VEERRREIIAATVPLLEQEGFAISTRKIADAAGIAEGTIFRVFATKEELLYAAIESYMNPADLIERIEAIECALPLADKLGQIMEIVQESALRAHTFMVSMRGKNLMLSEQTKARRPHHQFTTHSAALAGAIEGTLSCNESELLTDLSTAARYILTLGLASLIVKSSFPDSGFGDTVALTLRALTGKGI